MIRRQPGSPKNAHRRGRRADLFTAKARRRQGIRREVICAGGQHERLWNYCRILGWMGWEAGSFPSGVKYANDKAPGGLG